MAIFEPTRAIRNIGRRPLSLTFKRETVKVFPKKTSEFIPEGKWNDGGFALEQANKYVADHEAVWVKGPDTSANHNGSGGSNIREANVDEILSNGGEK